MQTAVARHRVFAFVVVAVAALGAVVYRQCLLATSARWLQSQLADSALVPEPLGVPPAETASFVAPNTDPATVIPATPALNRDPDGTLLWEAEWANRVTGSFACLPSVGASGGVALWEREGTGRNNGLEYVPPNKPNVALGLADYYLDLPRGGWYRLLMRLWTAGACSNSCWVGVDTDTNLQYFPGGLKGRFGQAHYHWPERMCYRWLWIDDEGSVYRLERGPHRLRIDVREDGIGIDQIALVPVGRSWPIGTPASTVLPGRGKWPADVRLSPDTPSTRASNVATPFDGFLAVDNHCLTPDAAPATTGWLWLRANVPDPQQLTVKLTCPGATLTPTRALRCGLSGATPFARVPLKVTFPATTERRGFALVATITSAACPGLTVVRSCRLERPLDWWAVGPLSPEQAGAVEGALLAATTVDVTRSPVLALPDLKWVRVNAPEHYDAFGAVDLGRLFGPQEHRVAYVATQIRVRASGRYSLLAASDDSLRLLCDGKTLLDLQHWAPLTDDVRRYSIALDKGAHLLVARVTQETSCWQMLVRFENPNGNPTGEVVGLVMTPD